MRTIIAEKKQKERNQLTPDVNNMTPMQAERLLKNRDQYEYSYNLLEWKQIKLIASQRI